ncbi:DUF2145 domain-containing protein [Arenimonas alkanexedens]
MRRLLRASLLALGLVVGTAQAGTACTATSSGPTQIAEAAQSARRVFDQLEAMDVPVALVSRAGTDLSGYGLHYSHVGFVLRDHPNGRWTVVHLLNRCGSDRSGVFTQGLVNYFLDDLVTQDARITWLEPALAARLVPQLLGDAPLRLHEPRYNMIAPHEGLRSQNSTAWVIEQLSAARLPVGALPDRRQVQAVQQADGFQPDRLQIAYSKRVLGGLFSANTDFGEHSLGTRLSGDYPVVTVRSILRHLDRLGLVQHEWEWRDGRESAAPGPA